ncbi:MAG: Xaa-Pro peptidase family protein [Acidobacteria bacterium]|jgi:Xaa-Pro aminopeptidase|nr:Xaa-Pro peptidase family protein [Acidobacteriota bacterium]
MKKKKKKTTRPRRPTARLLYAASETEADMLYPTGFFAPDPFLFIQKGRRTVLVMSDLEMDRARRQARVDRVMSWSKIAAPLEKNGKKPATADVIAQALKTLGLKRVEVPGSFPLGLAMELDERGIRLDLVADPFWPEREVKRPDEVRAIEASLRAAEEGLLAGIEALKACRIRKGWLMRDGRRFTAEDLRSVINTRVMAEGCVPAHTICAPGDQAVDPHDEGHGPIRAHTPVIMDIFPRSEKTGYFGDLTRTVVRGKASFALHELYAIVHEGVRLGHRRVREGIEGLDVHKEIQDLFTRQGYKTGVQEGRMQGFFHGTGHGVGLQIHEAPSIGKRPCTLRAGHVVTIEPGLYYLGLGGVRIEDMALVRKRDSRCLTRVPKQLEI